VNRRFVPMTRRCIRGNGVALLWEASPSGGPQELLRPTCSSAAAIRLRIANLPRFQQTKFLVKHISRAHAQPLPPPPSEPARVLPSPSHGWRSLLESWSKSRLSLLDFNQSLRFCRGHTHKASSEVHSPGWEPGAKRCGSCSHRAHHSPCWI